MKKVRKAEYFKIDPKNKDEKYSIMLLEDSEPACLVSASNLSTIVSVAKQWEEARA